MSVLPRFLLLAALAWLSLPASSQVAPFAWHDKGFVPFHASQVDARFPYMLYVPEDYDEQSPKQYPLIVLVHGTERGPHYYLEQNRAFAEEYDVILLAPLFPVGTHGGQDLENYKLIEFKGTRYDLILLSMVDEVMSKYNIDANQFSLFGFSGGGHFTHRFFYLHPHRLKAVSIGAPGMVTLIDDTKNWWVGTRDVYLKFNARLNPARMKAVPVQMLVGAEDTESWGDEIEKESVYYMGDAPGATYNAAGKNRPERLQTLRKNWEKHGIAVRFETVAGAGHDETDMFPSMQKFFVEAIPLRKPSE